MTQTIDSLEGLDFSNPEDAATTDQKRKQILADIAGSLSLELSNRVGDSKDEDEYLRVLEFEGEEYRLAQNGDILELNGAPLDIHPRMNMVLLRLMDNPGEKMQRSQFWGDFINQELSDGISESTLSMYFAKGVRKLGSELQKVNPRLFARTGTQGSTRYVFAPNERQILEDESIGTLSARKSEVSVEAQQQDEQDKYAFVLTGEEEQRLNELHGDSRVQIAIKTMLTSQHAVTERQVMANLWANSIRLNTLEVRTLMNQLKKEVPDINSGFDARDGVTKYYFAPPKK